MSLWGCRIHVIGAHDTRAEGKIRGATFRAAYVDEASLIPESAWVVLVQRCAMGGAKIFATTNPDSPSHYIKKDFLDDNPDVAGFHFTMYDNPILTEKERDYLSRQHKGLWYKRFVLGEWVLAEGAVFDFFDEKIHVIEKQPASAKFYLVGVDVGFTNPTAFTMVGYNDEASPALWVEQEYIWNSKEKGSAKTDSDYAADLARFCSTRQNIKFIYIDPAAAGFKVEMRRSGIGIPIMDAKNEVLDGIRTMSSLIANGDLKILSSCKHLIGEMQSYCWDPKSSQRGYDAPLKHNDHLTDSLRYAIFSYFGEKLTLKQPQITQEAIGGRSLSFNRPIGPRAGGTNLFHNIHDFDPRNSVPDMICEAVLVNYSLGKSSEML